MNRLGLGLAVGAGYVLGRTKKMKLAFAIGTMVAGKRMHLSPRALADLVTGQLQNNPQFKEIGDQLREDLRGVGKAASGALVERQIEGLADRLHGRTAQVRDQLSGVVPEVPGVGGKSGGKSRDDREDEPEDEYEDYDEYDERDPDASDDEVGERESAEDAEDAEAAEDEERPRPRKRAPAKKAAKKAPAKKAAEKRSPRKEAPAKKTAARAAKKAPAKKTAAARTAGRSASRGRLTRGGGDND
ncbi:DNA primase [Streptomyces phaeochromogenes]|uniref:DNA primase n=1 Tax=Streptomyces phaeochromogenes TaxID=1923 RepID=UPI002DD7DA69|nr:DNA primase [Streptomyces phaeochromogenes]WRZ28156.1 DNA primase [Streptomyces phaeochromogenes]WSJ09310.1 DNA primase [Streptomyces phaeochromogenes]